MPSCRPGLTIVGFGWSFLSLLSAGSVSGGFYWTTWLIGGNVSSYSVEFGCFRLCYPTLTGQSRSLGIPTLTCGRYDPFDEIPSIWWKMTTITVGIGSAISVLVAFITVPAWCISDVVSRASARMLGIHQLIAAILICVGCVLYPLGWDNKWVKEACSRPSPVGPYVQGDCKFGWAFYVTLGGACALFICASLSAIAGRPIEWRRLVFDDETTATVTVSAVTPTKGSD